MTSGGSSVRRSGYIPALDGLRFIAFFLVYMHHSFYTRYDALCVFVVRRRAVYSLERLSDYAPVARREARYRDDLVEALWHAPHSAHLAALLRDGLAVLGSGLIQLRRQLPAAFSQLHHLPQQYPLGVFRMAQHAGHQPALDDFQ
jgi:hypothetical protein